MREYADGRRKALLVLGSPRGRYRKNLTMAGGVIALLSGGSSAALLAPINDATGYKIAGAVLGFLAGAVTLVSNIYYDDKDTTRMFQGAAAFAQLRDEIDEVMLQPNVTEARLYEAYKREYPRNNKLCGEYDPLMGHHTVAQISDAVSKKLYGR
jgi:hypothetical protein